MNINYQQLIFNLLRKGYTETTIGKKVGCSQVTINQLKNQYVTRRYLDERTLKLIDLHFDECPDKHQGLLIDA